MRQALRCALYTQTAQGVSQVSARGREEGKSHSNGPSGTYWGLARTGPRPEKRRGRPRPGACDAGNSTRFLPSKSEPLLLPLWSPQQRAAGESQGGAGTRRASAGLFHTVRGVTHGPSEPGASHRPQGTEAGKGSATALRHTPWGGARLQSMGPSLPRASPQGAPQSQASATPCIQPEGKEEGRS